MHLDPSLQSQHFVARPAKPCNRAKQAPKGIGRPDNVSIPHELMKCTHTSHSPRGRNKWKKESTSLSGKPCRNTPHKSKICSLYGYLWRRAAGSLFRGHVRSVACHMISHRALVQTRLQAPEGEDNQGGNRYAQRCPVFGHPSSPRDSVWSRVQLDKQTAAEEPDMERTVGKLTVDRQHRLHAKRLRPSTVNIKPTHVSKRQTLQLKKSSLNAAWDQALPDTWYVTTDQEQHKKCMPMRSGLQKKRLRVTS